MAAAWVVAVVIVIIFLFNTLVWAANENSSAARRRCWASGPLVVSQRSPGVPRSARPQQFWAWDIIHMPDLYTGIAGGAAGLSCYRLFCFGVFCFTIVLGRALEGPDPSMMAYFTNWTFVLWAFTCVYGAALTAQVWRQQHAAAASQQQQQQQQQQFPSSTAQGAPVGNLQPRWAFKHKLHLLLLDTVCAASITLTIFYWAAVFKKGSGVGFDNPMKHGVSAFLLLLELLLSRAPLVSYHLQAPLAFGTGYLVVMWVYQAATGKKLYLALDWSPISIAFYIALPLLTVVSFVVMFVVVGLRELIVTRSCFLQCCCCCRPSRSSSPAAVEVVVAPSRADSGVGKPADGTAG